MLTIRRYDNDTFTRQRRNDFMVYNASITLTTITRALRDNAYLRPVCTALEVEWLWWVGQKTWTLLS